MRCFQSTATEDIDIKTYYLSSSFIIRVDIDFVVLFEIIFVVNKLALVIILD